MTAMLTFLCLTVVHTNRMSLQWIYKHNILTVKIASKMSFQNYVYFADIIKDSIKPYTAADSNTFKTLIVFDCRGVEPVEFSPRVNFYLHCHIIEPYLKIVF